MIYTCTLNPAIDLFIETKHLQPEVVNRTNSYDIQPNGKGVNVSFILKQLGIDNTALGVGGGFTSDFIEQSLRDKKIETDFTQIDGISRINVFTRVVDSDTEYKEVNPGPEVSPEEINGFLGKIAQLTATDELVVSGSFSTGIEPSIIVTISQMAQRQGFKLIIDTSYREVMETLPNRPFLLKPNDAELLSWFHADQTDDLKTLITYARTLITRGAQNILLSLGKNGALFIDQDEAFYGNAPDVKVVNTACSGDTMLATFLAGMQQQLSPADNLKRSVAAASSTAGRAGLTDFSDVAELMKHVEIKEI